MESTSKPSFTWPLASSKPRARTPITAKPIGQPPHAPLPRVPRASVPPPMVAEPVAPLRVEVARPWMEPVRVEPPPILVESEPEPVFYEAEPETDRDPEPFPELAAMSTFGAGVLGARRGTNKFFVVAVLLAVIAVVALVLR